MPLVQTVAPASEPVTLEEIKAHLKIADVSYSDTGESTTGSDFNNTTSPLTVTDAVTRYPQITFTPGTNIRIDDEVVQVWSVTVNDVTFGRGQQDTLVVAHVSSKTLYTVTGYDDEDDDLNAMITECRERIEGHTWCQFLTATWEMRLSAFPANNGDITVPRPPLQSVTSIEYIDTEGVEQTLSASAYDVGIYQIPEPGIIRPAYGEVWPATRPQLDAVVVTFVAGFTLVSSVPSSVKRALKTLLADSYEQRESTAVEQGVVVMPLPHGAEYWLRPCVVHDERLLEFM